MRFDTRVLLFLIALVIALAILWLYLARATAPAQGTPLAAPSFATTTIDQSSTSTSAEAALPPPDRATVAAHIVGSWQSVDDSLYTVTISANGKWTDAYGTSTSASETGTYTFFSSSDPDKKFDGTLVPGVVYIKLVEGKSTFFYSVLAADGNQLQLSYLARGNTLSFVRVQ